MPRAGKLSLPVMKQAPPAARWLSMDDYVKFVAFNLKYTLDKKVIRKQKKLAAVNIPFLLT